MPLSAFSKTFGITELKKGYFPHLSNTIDHQDYVGEVPAMDYYMTESMLPKRKKEFEVWHKDQREKNVVFDFQKELVEYCVSDVELPKQGCLTFKELFEHNSGFNPFEKITLTSACNHHLRLNRTIRDSIASEPLRGWKLQINQSIAAKEWLHWLDHSYRRGALEKLSPEDLEAHDLMALAYPDYPHPSYRPYIRHAGNDGEFQILLTVITRTQTLSLNFMVAIGMDARNVSPIVTKST